MSIQELLDASVVISESKTTDTAQPKHASVPPHHKEARAQGPFVPAPPTGLSVVVTDKLQLLQPIADMLKDPNNSNVHSHSTRIKLLRVFHYTMGSKKKRISLPEPDSE
jgi:hypothetical protein